MQGENFDNFSRYIKPAMAWFFEHAKAWWETIALLMSKAYVLLTQSFLFFENVSDNLLESSKEKYGIAKPLVIELAKNKPVFSGMTGLAILALLIFWMWMLWHAAKREPTRKKTWVLFVLILGPLGALAYYFGRKRILEKKRKSARKSHVQFFCAHGKAH